MKKVLKFFGIYSVSSKIMGMKSSGMQDIPRNVRAGNKKANFGDPNAPL